MPDRLDKLEHLKESCIASLEKEDRIIVFGEGSPTSKIVLVGEAPGEQETKQRKPFVGQAGKNLSHFLDVLGLMREEIYITNVVKFRPYRINPNTGRKVNRPPNREEIALCSRWLKEEVGIIDPAVIVTLGNVPLKALLGQGATVGELHGKSEICTDFVDGASFYVFCLYHPASIIYRRELLQTYEEDLAKLKLYLARG